MLKAVQHKIVMVGAFPPPMHGMAAVNATVRNRLQSKCAVLLVIDVAAPSLRRELWPRLARLPRVLYGLLRLLLTRQLRNHPLYMSVSGGLGQIYELLFLIVARSKGMRVVLHHHSYAYIDKPKRLTSYLTKCAGSSAIHVTLTTGMAARLKASNSNIRRVIPISNAALIMQASVNMQPVKQRLRTIGFISNIAPEKGIFEYLELYASIRDSKLAVQAKLAGPFNSADTERHVQDKLALLPQLEYVGPQYGKQKEVFYASIDVLIFPTRYKNEAEPLVIHEAMSRGIPVIAYGRGCIPEIVTPDCGLVIEPNQPFAPAALAQIRTWIYDQNSFTQASRVAAERFDQLYVESQYRWRSFMDYLSGISTEAPDQEQERTSLQI